MSEIIRFYDDDGNALDEMEYSIDAACKPRGTGDFCGGCCRCLAMQASFVGTCYEIVPDESLLFPMSK